MAEPGGDPQGLNYLLPGPFQSLLLLLGGIQAPCCECTHTHTHTHTHTQPCGEASMDIIASNHSTATHSSILAWRIPWTEKPGKLWSSESQRIRYN